MFGIFAVIALVLSSVGLYAVMAYSVTQRTQEIGVRMAVGAQPWQVSWLILERGLVQLAMGLTIGLGGRAGAGRACCGRGITPADPATFAADRAAPDGRLASRPACCRPAAPRASIRSSRCGRTELSLNRRSGD